MHVAVQKVNAEAKPVSRPRLSGHLESLKEIA
jgi:hypothetical protein